MVHLIVLFNFHFVWATLVIGKYGLIIIGIRLLERERESGYLIGHHTHNFSLILNCSQVCSFMLDLYMKFFCSEAYMGLILYYSALYESDGEIPNFSFGCLCKMFFIVWNQSYCEPRRRSGWMLNSVLHNTVFLKPNNVLAVNDWYAISRLLKV